MTESVYPKGTEFIETAYECGLTRLFESEEAKLKRYEELYAQIKATRDEINESEKKITELNEANELLDTFQEEMNIYETNTSQYICTQFIYNLCECNVICNLHVLLNHSDYPLMGNTFIDVIKTTSDGQSKMGFC